MNDDTTPVHSTIPVAANPPELNDARLDRLNVDTMYVGHIQSAVLWHIEAKRGGCASKDELEDVVVAASNAAYISKLVSGFGRRIVDNMIRIGILSQVLVDGDDIDFPCDVALGIGERGYAALRHLESRGIYNPHLTETNND